MGNDMTFSQSVGYVGPDVEALRQAYVGKSVSDLPTPSCILNRTVIARNCDAMLENAASLGLSFRAHIKTHKTLEGVRLQLGRAGHGKVIVSTVMEAHALLPLVEEGLVTDVLYGLPVVRSRIPELAALSERTPNLRLMLDSEAQLESLLHFSASSGSRTRRWSLFVKVDCGTHRAGLVADSSGLNALIERALSPEMAAVVEIYGFYCHAGHSYAATSEQAAKAILLEELRCADAAVTYARSLDGADRPDYVLSVGATPTAHASALLTPSELTALDLRGPVELHAGCYPFCDLQQYATGLVPYGNIAIRVVAEVVSRYPDRRELLINAGTCALARETGPIEGYGNVEVDGGDSGWFVGRTSQEHGILVRRQGGDHEGRETSVLSVGEKVLVIPQHACITGACYQWYFVVEDAGIDAKVVDVWRRFNGW